jgi:MoaA/NifB/PqqE/SkfB family radical SAM enzyme
MKRDGPPNKFFIPAEKIETKVKETELWNNLHSKSWCPVPFNTISWHPSGVVSRCMMSDDDMGTHHDSTEMQDLRKNMLAGKWDTFGCTNCLTKEKQGARSQRMNWLHHDFREGLGNPEPYNNPKLLGNDISHLFVNFSNVCNFKCRMCSSNYSNSLIPEAKHMEPLFPREYRKVATSNPKNFNNINEYLEANPEVLKGIRSIWMTGGEPFMTEDPYKLMELIEEHGHPELIKMVVTTNGSRLDVERLDAFKKLKKLTLDISIDAVGPMFEYMRSNGVFTWSEMEKKIGQLKVFYEQNKAKEKRDDWFSFQINSSYQAFNYDNMPEFFQFIHDMGCDSNVRLVIFPEHLRVGNLPDEYKKEALKQMDMIEVRYGNRNQHNIKTLDDMRKAIHKKDQKLEVFKTLVKEQDKFRGTYLYDYHPHLAQVIYGDIQPRLF